MTASSAISPESDRDLSYPLECGSSFLWFPFAHTHIFISLMKILLVCGIRSTYAWASVCVHAHSEWKAWRILESDFLTAWGQKNPALGRAWQLKYSSLREGKTSRQSKENRFSIPPASGSKGHLFNLKTITLLPSFPNHRLKHIPRGLSCSVSVCCFDLVHTLTSPPAQAWPLPFYPHSRDCERHTNRDFKNIIIKPCTSTILCGPARVNMRCLHTMQQAAKVLMSPTTPLSSHMFCTLKIIVNIYCHLHLIEYIWHIYIGALILQYITLYVTNL